MADANLTPRQLADVLHRLDQIESHSRRIREQLIEVMADRRRTAGVPEGAARGGETAHPRSGRHGAAAVRRRRAERDTRRKA